MINAQQRESYRQALEAWRNAARAAQPVKDRIYTAPTNPQDMYLITDQDINYLQKECDTYQRLATIARQL
jgi:hypothetical protein